MCFCCCVVVVVAAALLLLLRTFLLVVLRVIFKNQPLACWSLSSSLYVFFFFLIFFLMLLLECVILLNTFHCTLLYNGQYSCSTVSELVPVVHFKMCACLYSLERGSSCYATFFVNEKQTKESANTHLTVHTLTQRLLCTSRLLPLFGSGYSYRLQFQRDMIV